MIELLREVGAPQAGGMVHAFSGSLESAHAYVAMGLHVSFALSVTSRHAKKLRRAAAHVDASRLLAETDAPDQHVPDRAHGAPAELVSALEVLADLRGQSLDEVGRMTAENARRLFRLPASG